MREVVTILGYGSLLSASSTKLTMPSSHNFRYVRILGHRRCFAHISPLFSEAGIARPETLELASLSAEPCAGSSFMGVAFDIPRDEWGAFVDRELEYVIALARFEPLDGAGDGPPEGMLCTRGSDALLRERGVWSRYEAAFDAYAPPIASRTCWDWGEASGLLPCACYLRHCLLSSRRAGIPAAVRESFLDNTYLVDRKTTLREYLSRPGVEEKVMSSLPPPNLETRYGG
jgi:hypothetical protein